ncbi:putative sur7 protein [Phaeoacremonium minimum UCRPA7]|uniref:Putative sur7 protein n=1 Tax=Phaeoacremonium minimum (strain UCR-PA7) TaxID=1286976 RepID=R8BPG4_PHAM7|nr:putative sur7 protein [Phaeoacremonium minimum UCRPA7]EOO01190.1 putative sur7 protein [Phaeoacremonium minimum UCRPA7]
MEDYHIIMFNTSELGHNLVPTPTSGNSGPTSTSGGGGIGGFWTSLVSEATAAVGAIESELASIENDIADELAKALGIKEFYSLHIMDACEGYFKPNATTPHAGYNVTNCTEPMDTSYLNVSALLDEELRVGPFEISLNDLGFSDDLQEKLDEVPKLFMAMSVLYILGAGFSGLSLLGSLAALFMLPQSGRILVLVNFTLTFLAMVCLLAGNLATTIGGKKVVDAVADFGDDIGLYASRGDKFMALVWTAFALMAVSTIYWGYEFFAETRMRRGGVQRRVKEERYSMDSYPRGARH